MKQKKREELIHDLSTLYNQREELNKLGHDIFIQCCNFFDGYPQQVGEKFKPWIRDETNRLITQLIKDDVDSKIIEFEGKL